jgi:hypothetical protein
MSIKSTFSKLLPFSVLCVAIVIAISLACESQQQVETKMMDQPVSARLSAVDLCSNYEANEISADDRYKGKVLAVTGKVESIGKDILDDMFVVLAGSNEEYSMVGVQCSFSNSQKSTLISLRKGETVTVKGRCDGKMMYVQLKGCVFQ